jgi:hypothetical protein
MYSKWLESARLTVERLKRLSPWDVASWDEAELLADSLASAARLPSPTARHAAQLHRDLGALILREADILSPPPKGGAT